MNKIAISVVMVVHDEAEALEQNLPLFLTQQCERAVEVIVVDDASTDDTPDVLKRLKATYPNLYTTFIPPSPPNPWRRRLALTIGAKAAKGEYVTLASIHRPPQTDSLLEELLQIMTSDKAVVSTVYYSRKQDGATRYRSWDDLEQVVPMLRKAERCSGHGHQGRWMKVARGLYDVLIVPHNRIHDTLHYYDENIRGFKLMCLRLQVLLRFH